MADEETQDTFPRKYVEELRDEAARYRTELKKFKAPFEGFNAAEIDYLFDIVSTLGTDQKGGALKVRDLAKNILKEEFYEGLDDLPQPEAPAEEETQDLTPKEEPVTDSLTAEQLQKMLDEREAKAREEAEIEGIFREIEEAGFERGTEGFITALSLAQTQASLGKDVDFKVLAPKVHTILGTEAPAEESSEEDASDAATASTDAAVASATETAVEGDRDFPKTPAAAGTTGAPGEAKTDWLDKAREAGKSPLEAARERLEARLGE